MADNKLIKAISNEINSYETEVNLLAVGIAGVGKVCLYLFFVDLLEYFTQTIKDLCSIR